MNQLVAALLAVLANTGESVPRPAPIIDVHLHAYPADAAFSAGLANNPVTGKPSGVANGEAHRKACLAEMERLNIVRGVVSGAGGDRVAEAVRWSEAAPARIIAAAGLRGSAEDPLPGIGELRQAVVDGRIRALGEVSAQYAGLTLNDAKFEPYLALAEELDIPVAVHTGISYPGVSYERCCRGFRTGLGNPALVEETLNRHPKLRVSLMHAGWPYLQETIAIMSVYPQVYADLGVIDWAIPREEFHHHLKALLRAGFGKRLMFGSDQMHWPDAIALAVEGVESATFLTPEQKRDIFYNNAVRFFRLEKSLAAKPVTSWD